MITYWCNFLDAAGHIFGTEAMRAEDDAAAIARAKVIFAHGIGSGYEIRDGERLVLRRGRGGDPSGARHGHAA